MSGKTDVQFFYVVVTTNENPGSNQSLASVRVLFDARTDRLPPCRTGANTFYILQYDFVCVQTRFTSCNTISYACKHVLRLAIRFRTHANTFCIVAIRFRMCANTFYIVAATDSEVNMTVTSLQQLIRGSI